MLERRPALGKGLSALIPDVPEPREGGTDRSRHRSAGAESTATASEHGRRQAGGAGRVDQIERHHSADPGSPNRRHRIESLPASGDGAQRSEPGCSESRSSSGTLPKATSSCSSSRLIENLQREGLNPIDEALAYQRLADDFSLTQEQIAAAVGKDRSSVANFMRLLKLPEEVRSDLASGTLSTGHARALLALPDAAAQRHGAREVIARRLSVRETEALVKKLASPKSRETGAARNVDNVADVHTRAAEDRMRFALGTKVRIIRRGDRRANRD